MLVENNFPFYLTYQHILRLAGCLDAGNGLQKSIIQYNVVRLDEMIIIFYSIQQNKFNKNNKNWFSPECYNIVAWRRSKLIIHENSVLLTTKESKKAMIMMRVELFQMKKN